MAQINFGLLNPETPANVANSFARGQQMAMQQEIAQNALAESKFKMQQMQQAQTAQNALNEAYRSAYNPQTGEINQNALMQSLASGGVGSEIPKVQKMIAEQSKLQREADKQRLENGLKTFDFLGQLANGIKDQSTYERAIAQAATVLPREALAQLPREYNPAEVEQFKQQSLTFKEKLANEWQQKGYDLDVAKFGYQQQNDAANRAVTMRGQNLVDARGKEANRLKQQENEITKQGIVGKKIQDIELKLQDDYRAESKGFSETSTAMKKILGAIETADKNPGSALAAGTAFMKLLDPNSVVRESELGMALNASGWFDRALNVAETIQSGKVMTSTQKQNLKKAAETLFEEAKAAQREVDSAYEQRAKAYGADPSRVIVDRGQRQSKMSDMDKQALEWANANPNDPRSAQIKQKLGVR